MKDRFNQTCPVTFALKFEDEEASGKPSLFEFSSEIMGMKPVLYELSFKMKGPYAVLLHCFLDMVAGWFESPYQNHFVVAGAYFTLFQAQISNCNCCVPLHVMFWSFGAFAVTEALGCNVVVEKLRENLQDGNGPMYCQKEDKKARRQTQPSMFGALL